MSYSFNTSVRKNLIKLACSTLYLIEVAFIWISSTLHLGQDACFRFLDYNSIDCDV